MRFRPPFDCFFVICTGILFFPYLLPPLILFEIRFMVRSRHAVVDFVKRVTMVTLGFWPLSPVIVG